MAVNVIVLGVSLLMAAFFCLWIFFSQLRAWMEMPKHRFLEMQQRFPRVSRGIEPDCKEIATPDEEK